MNSLRLALFAATLAFAAPARAERFAIEYDAAIYGVLDLGEIYMDLSVGSDAYSLTAKLRSQGLLRWFEPTDLMGRAQGALSDNALSWQRYDLDHSYSKKRRVTTLRRDETGAVSAQITPNHRHWGEPPASDAHKREARDPLSSIVAMSLDVARGGRCNGRYPVFDGRFRYDLILGGGKSGKLDRAGFEGRVLKCELRYQSIAGYNPSDKNEKRRLQKGEIWFGLVEGAPVAPMVRALIPTERGKAGISLQRFERPAGALETEATLTSPP